MRELSLFFNGDSLGWEEFVPVDGLVNANSAQAVKAIQFDVGGKDMHGVIAVRDWNEKVEDIAFIFLVSLRCLSSSFPLRVPSVSVLCPVFVGFFHASRVHLMLCQILAPLLEYLKLFLIVTADFLIFLHNSSQSMHDEDEFLRSRGPVSFKSGTHRARRELQLTELCGSSCDGHGD